ncbi:MULTISPECIES: DUF4113 domain-containing protein [unclassified Flavobacterium]|nr:MULTISPECIES: DUF4113 domain-containing protein [unclassified Flavobacterium]
MPFPISNLNPLYNDSLDRRWKMKQEKLFPSFTTKIKEIISIKL